jgi:hypothetical protein
MQKQEWGTIGASDNGVDKPPGNDVSYTPQIIPRNSYFLCTS